ADAVPVDWTSTGRIVFRTTQPPVGLWSVSPVGGEPEPLLASQLAFYLPAAASVSPDGMALAHFFFGQDGLFKIWISSPPGATSKAYEPAPFASRVFANAPALKFSPDGKQILLIRNAGN